MNDSYLIPVCKKGKYPTIKKYIGRSYEDVIEKIINDYLPDDEDYPDSWKEFVKIMTSHNIYFGEISIVEEWS